MIIDFSDEFNDFITSSVAECLKSALAPHNFTNSVGRLGRGPMANEAIQGHECGAYVALGRFAETEHGMA